MKGLKKIFASKTGWLLLLIILLLVNFLSTIFHSRIDLTKEKRYTLSAATKNLLRGLEEDVQIDVFLKGEFPAGFRKLANSTQEFLELLKDRNGSKIHYRFISPLDNIEGARINYGDSLVNLGATPINLTVQKEAGQSSNIIFPVALMQYKGQQTLINLYPGASNKISQVEINSAEALMEYQFAKALDKMTKASKPGIAYNIGNDEPTDGRTFEMSQALGSDYRFLTMNLNTYPTVPDSVDVLMIVKPATAFTEEEKFKIDQFVMRGGKLLCFIDNLYAEQDSLAYKPETIAFDRGLNLTDLFFRYGLRINTDLVMDLQCDMIPFVVGGTAENPQYEFLHWNYYPLLSPAPGQALNKNLGYIAGRFANSIDTIRVADIWKTPLLVSSPNSRIISTPALISLNENKNAPEDAKFKSNAIPVAMLLEGKFTSFYKNRVTKAQTDSLSAQGFRFNGASTDNKMIIVADGDIVLNEFIPGDGPNSQPIPLPMGWNRFTYGEYQKQSEYGKLFIPVANREFLLSCVEYLVSDPAISQTRNKDIVLRLLDSLTWQLVNIVLPVLLVFLSGFIYQQARKRKYAA